MCTLSKEHFSFGVSQVGYKLFASQYNKSIRFIGGTSGFDQSIDR